MHGLEAEYGAAMAFSRLNVAEPQNAEVQRSFRLRGHPSIAIVDARGVTVATLIGVQSADTLRLLIVQALNPE